jgi:hypothetical protein
VIDVVAPVKRVFASKQNNLGVRSSQGNKEKTIEVKTPKTKKMELSVVAKPSFAC